MSKKSFNKKCRKCSKCSKPNNIYWFGVSTEDPGNLRALSPELSQSSFTNGINIRFNQDGKHSDGLIYTDFVAKKLRYCNKAGFKLSKLSARTGNLTNFAISGASANNNFFLFQNQLPPNFSFETQVDKFCSLLLNSNTEITDEDIFFYTGAGAIDSLITTLSASAVPPQNIPAFIDSQADIFANTTVANIDKLYQKGCRRLFLQVFNSGVDKLGVFLKLETAFPGTLVLANSIVAAQSAKLDAAIAAAKPSWVGMEITKYGLEILDEFFDNPALYGIATPVLSFNPPTGLPLNTQADTGAWPVNEPLPVVNAKNLLYIDDSLHFTQHTAKQYSKFILDYIVPL